MSILVKNSQLNEDTISALNSLVDMDINASAAFRLTRIYKELSSIVDDKNKMEKKIMEKWAARDEEGNISTVLDEQGNPIPGAVNITDPDAFTKEMSDLMELENEIPYEKLSFEDLQLKTAKVKDLMTLEFLFD